MNPFRPFVLLAVALLAGGGKVGRAAEQVVSIDEALSSAQAWAVQNLDEDALEVLNQVDQEKVRSFLKALERDLQGKYVLDLAQLREGARTVLPILEAYEETEAYAIWLKSRLDYFDIAEELRLAIPAPKPAPLPDRPSVPLPNPTPQRERDIWIEKVSTRPWPAAARPYVNRLKPIFVAEKVPAELVWIAEVESSFDPRAVSPAGAAGLYQLMPATARQYGLSTWPLDQRFNPEVSARAAARHLRYLYGRFKDWRLVLAAYNAGEGRVQNLLVRTETKTFDAVAAQLPAETQMYVPKVEAVLLRREGVRLSDLARN